MQKIYPTSKLLLNTSLYNFDFERRPFLIIGYSEDITSYSDEPFGTNFYEKVLNNGNNLLLAKFTKIQLIKETFDGSGESITFNNITKTYTTINSTNYPIISDIEGLVSGYDDDDNPIIYHTLVSAILSKSEISLALDSSQINLLGAVNIIDANYSYTQPITHDYDVYNQDIHQVTSGYDTEILNRIIPISLISFSSINIDSDDLIEIKFLLA